MTKKVIQTHHISYDPEETVVITKGEHFILTRMQWLKTPSKGFIKSLKAYIALNEDRAIELKKDNGKKNKRQTQKSKDSSN